ncbi:tetratricopeptide repeat protein [Pontibacter sp. G13]|uniref:tetratricopeptide repeat protein n=1 Tax=Pontibacter sp. G13 TaxID=3074898 RepID=UPI00288A9321|nr:tetratricopeptide repeat protein [Pontibacter sp. G13]WNJ18542.1 tetratricopeptide repeat protein [Pontibacter sp. G13]
MDTPNLPSIPEFAGLSVDASSIPASINEWAREQTGAIYEALDENSHIYYISGNSGTGKQFIALSFIEQYGEQYERCIWLNLPKHQLALIHPLHYLIQATTPDLPILPDPKDRVESWLEALSEREEAGLLVLEAAEDDMLPYLKQLEETGAWDVLILSEEPFEDTEFNLFLPPLEKKHAAQLFKAIYPSSTDHDKSAAHIVRISGRLPFVLNIFGSSCEHGLIPDVDACIESLDELGLVPKRRSVNPPSKLIHGLISSLHFDETLKEILYTISRFPAGTIPLQYFHGRAGFPMEELAMLAEAGWIRLDSFSVSVHEILLEALAQIDLFSQSVDQTIRTQLIEEVATLPHVPIPYQFQIIERAIYLILQEDDASHDLVDTFFQIGRQLKQLGMEEEVVHCGEVFIDWCNDEFKWDIPEVTPTAEAVDTPQIEEAAPQPEVHIPSESPQEDPSLEMAQRILKLKLDSEGPDHPDTLRARIMYSEVLLDQGQSREAQHQLEQVLAHSIVSRDPEVASWWHARGLICVAYFANKHASKSRMMLKRVLKYLQQNPLDTSEARMGLEWRLALLLRKMNDTKLARDLLMRVMEHQIRSLGPTHPKIGKLLFNIAQVHATRREWSLSTGYFKQALIVMGQTLPEDAPDVLEAQRLLDLTQIQLDKEQSKSVRRRR